MSPYRLSLLQEFWAEYKDLPVNPPASPGRGGEAHFRKATIITGRAFLPFTPSAPGRARHSLMALPPSPLALRSSVCYLKKKKGDWVALYFITYYTYILCFYFTDQVAFTENTMQNVSPTREYMDRWVCLLLFCSKNMAYLSDSYFCENRILNSISLQCFFSCFIFNNKVTPMSWAPLFICIVLTVIQSHYMDTPGSFVWVSQGNFAHGNDRITLQTTICLQERQ